MEIINRAWGGLKKAAAFACLITTCLLIIAILLMLITHIFHNPLHEYLQAGKNFLFKDNLPNISNDDKKTIIKLMSKGYILSSNELSERIGSYYSNTITILIFFCTFAGIFAVAYIKLNTEDRFDQTIKDKVSYFFTNDRSFSLELERVSNSAASDAVTAEMERLLLEDQITQTKNEIMELFSTLQSQIESLQGAISNLSPENDPDLIDVDEIVRAHQQERHE
ncbi:hypothetical protein [uncultured Enterobacter sp.]|uniref:hypothetical protein n=1 Tax=uncultured Enterobacter sp. TaxID=238202 RepID=UPI0025F91343|nr:hypothetical protein [uncultured Enterobacter sp.]